MIDIASNINSLPETNVLIQNTNQTEPKDGGYVSSICCGILVLVILAWWYAYFNNNV